MSEGDHLPVHAPQPQPRNGTWVQQIAPWVALVGLFAGALKYVNDIDARAAQLTTRMDALQERQSRDIAQQQRELEQQGRRLERMEDKIDAVLARIRGVTP